VSVGIFTAILGVASLVAGVGTIFHVEPLVALEGITFLLSPLWVVWLGIVIWRQ